MTKPADCVIEREPPYLIVRPKGYFADQLGLKISGMLFEKPDFRDIKYVIFDFSQVPVVNSQGIATLIDICGNLVDNYNISIGFCKMSNLASEAFQIAGLEQLATFFSNIDEAKAYFGM